MNRFEKHTTLKLITLLKEDFALLDSGEWIPDSDSISASVDVLDELERRAEGVANYPDGSQEQYDSFDDELNG